MESRVLVSLLSDPSESDGLLETIHRLLPVAHAASTALLRPPSTRLVGVVARALQRDVVVVAEAAAAVLFREAPPHDGPRVLVWCRDDAEAASLGDGVEALRADDVDTLAWEVVRRVAGDGGDTTTALPTPSAAAASQLPPIERPWPGLGQGDVSPPAAVEMTGRRLQPPAWAVARGGTDEAATPSAARPGAASRLAAPEWAAGRPVPVPPRIVPTDTPKAAATDEVDHGLRWQSADQLPSPLAGLAVALPRPEPEVEVAASSSGTAADSGLAAVQSSTGLRSESRRHGVWPLLADLRRAGLGLRPRDASPSPALASLGQELVRGHSTVVLVGTPKGGPGKTTQAAAIALLGAQAVEPHGGTAACVDANLNNPDAWKRLGLPAQAPAVRNLVDALNRGAVPPEGEMARDARLRVFPEVRGGGASYSGAEVDRLAQHLRVRHTLVVVDLPNVLPSLLHGPSEAVMAHWLRHADVFVVPVDLGAASFVAAGEMLDALDEFVAASNGALGMPGLVVPLLVPRGGEKVVRSPEVSELLDHLREAGATVVEVPQVVEVQAAEHFRRPVIGASPRADAAFVRVLEAVVAVATARRDDTSGSRHA